MTNEHRAKENHLLRVLPDAEWARLAARLVPVDMPLGQIVYESEANMENVYFPTTSVVSMLHLMHDGAPAEIAIVGNEGIVGIALFMGGETMPNRAIVQNAGQAYRLDARILKEEFDRAGPVQRLLLRYTQALITQMAQTVVCNQHHSTDQQICRWLLLSVDRLPLNEQKITLEFIVNMLGVPRAGMTEAAMKLQDAGLIRCSGDHIEVLDRQGLEKRACECYGVVKREFARLLPDVQAI
ncbi:Crp/Fnr family transcriptional regulator [Paraburkholderia sediminicola]|uniref:Crp/Fnr family transcriptional regulator n=1 Tax=Paraburkholderia sediminicola TaxID=458836 RepID=UPI000E712C46